MNALLSIIFRFFLVATLQVTNPFFIISLWNDLCLTLHAVCQNLM